MTLAKGGSTRRAVKLKESKARRSLRERSFCESLERQQSAPSQPLATHGSLLTKRSLEQLERRYLKTGNPLCVWEAIGFAVDAAMLENSPIILPNWIIAYLFWAHFEIMVAAQRPERDDPDAKPKKVGGITQQFSSTFYGMTGAERNEAIVHAIRFHEGAGRNLLLQESRRVKKEFDVHAIMSAIQVAKERGERLTVQAAVVLMGIERYLKGGVTRFYADKRELKGKT